MSPIQLCLVMLLVPQALFDFMDGDGTVPVQSALVSPVPHVPRMPLSVEL